MVSVSVAALSCCLDSLGGLNENGPHLLVYLDAWSLVGETFGEGFRGMALLEELCPRGGLEVSKSCTIPNYLPFSASNLRIRM